MRGFVRVITIGAAIWIVGAVGLSLFLHAYEQQFAPPEPQPENVRGRLSDQSGRAHGLNDYRGRPIVLAFVGDLRNPWSLEMLRALRDEIARFDAVGVKLFGVTSADAHQARLVHAELRLTFPLLVDSGRELTASTQVRTSDGVLCVIGPEGRVAARLADDRPDLQLAQALFWAQCGTQGQARSSSRSPVAVMRNYRLPDSPPNHPEMLRGDDTQKLTVVVFLSARCPCSRGYNGRLRALAERFMPRGVRFVGIYGGVDEAEAEIRAQARAERFPFRVVHDEDQMLTRAFGAEVTPEAYLLDQHGVVRYHGRLDDNRNPALVRRSDLREAIIAALRDVRPNPAETVAFGCAISTTAAGS